ncbi:MAG TPA: gamma-glutamyltransferase [Pyrinomonadaceae bacterium]|jgi:gamma-glutamyltranspeptidase/glutathione hydrolase
MGLRKRLLTVGLSALLCALALEPGREGRAQRTQKPPLHGRHWMAITGKPLGATAGAMAFQKGGNAVDAACAMLAATATMWDTLSWGGETQALIYNPKTGKVVGVNALGVAPTGATAAFYKGKGMRYPPEYGPLAAVTPGTPGGLMTMLAEYGKLSLKDVLDPAIQLADGFPIEAQLANTIERQKAEIKKWRYSPATMLPHAGQRREAPEPGEVFKQPDLAATLRKLVEAEQRALASGRDRRAAIYAAYDRFYKGDIAQEIARGTQEDGGLITAQDLANWKVRIEEPVKTTYKGVEVYKLTHWTQGPAMLQALNILENFDLKAMGFNSSRYVNTVYQAMSMAFADRDFYYGDPYFPPEEPIRGLLSKEYAKRRAAQLNQQRNDPNVKPGDPYPFQGSQANPFRELLDRWSPNPSNPATPPPPNQDTIRSSAAVRSSDEEFVRSFYAGTTSVEAADAEGWVVSITPSGGWVPAVIAGRTGVGLSQRAQSFVTDPAEGPFNVIEPGKLPRVTLTPTLALKDGKPYLAFAVQGGDSQDQNLLQFFLNVVEFGMTVQEATEAPNINSFQMRSSFGAHETRPGRILLAESMPPWVRTELRRMGYELTYEERTSGPINAILFDRAHGTMWGGSSNHGEDYGIAW